MARRSTTIAPGRRSPPAATRRAPRPIAGTLEVAGDPGADRPFARGEGRREDDRGRPHRVASERRHRRGQRDGEPLVERARRGRLRESTERLRDRGRPAGRAAARPAPRRAASRSSAASSATARRSVRPDGLGQAPEAERRQLAADVLGEGREEGHDLLGRPGELRPKVLALGGDAGGTRVEVALAGHVAADRDEGGGPEAVLLGAEERGDHDVATGLQPAVGAQHDAVAQALPDEHLVGLGQAELPRRPDGLDRRERAGAGAAGVAGDEHVVRVGLGDAGRDRADTGRGDELDPDPGRAG